MGYERGGGLNKTHGTIEQHPVLDSFKFNKFPLGKHTSLAEDGTGATVILEPNKMDISFLYFDSGKNKKTIVQRVNLHHIRNNFGGKPRAYFLCPDCGKHVRFIYFKENFFHCRQCAKLNYKSQQVTRGLHASIHRMGRILETNFDMMKIPAPIDACRLTPNKPKWMRQKTYSKKLLSLRAAQSSFKNAIVKRLGAVIGE